MHPLRKAGTSPEEQRRRAMAWIVVAAIHVFLLSIFLVSEAMPYLFRTRGVETVMELSRPGSSNQPSNEEEPRLPDLGSPYVVPAPITITPPPVKPQPSEAVPPNGADVLDAIGQELGCSAGGFEALTSAERLHCRRIPWGGIRLPNGAIALEPPPDYRFVPQPSGEPHLNGAEAERRALETAPQCPLMLNVPCLNNFVNDH